jgi:hypothetical protein
MLLLCGQMTTQNLTHNGYSEADMMKPLQMKCGIEYEYMLIDTEGEQAGRLRNFTNLDFESIADLLEAKPGKSDNNLAVGDLGIKNGYWYLEGDERFNADGSFHQMAVKGVEIRTPPRGSVNEAIAALKDIEHQLILTLRKHNLGLAISGFNPELAEYHYEPPLNQWETTLREQHFEYAASHISTLSYGPDINLSFSEMSIEKSLDVARKLTYYGPYIVPFSFSSPFSGGTRWLGLSKRTYERGGLRPTCKLFTNETLDSQLAYAARIPSEHGRIEFKAFDAITTAELLVACSYLLIGICLDHQLEARADQPDHCLYRQAALSGFADEKICHTAIDIINKSRIALIQHGEQQGAKALTLLGNMLATRRTPSHDLIEHYQRSGQMYYTGGLAI